MLASKTDMDACKYALKAGCGVLTSPASDFLLPTSCNAVDNSRPSRPNRSHNKTTRSESQNDVLNGVTDEQCCSGPSRRSLQASEHQATYRMGTSSRNRLPRRLDTAPAFPPQLATVLPGGISPTSSDIQQVRCTVAAFVLRNVAFGHRRCRCQPDVHFTRGKGL